jgi:flagellar basal-body rod protein FlgB
MALVDSTQQLLEAAMRGSWQRETALTNNISNADTPGYQPQEVSFETALQGAMNSGRSPSQVQFQTETKAVQAGPNGEAVSVDQESAKLAENGLDYQALTQVLDARNSIMREAMGVST